MLPTKDNSNSTSYTASGITKEIMSAAIEPEHDVRDLPALEDSRPFMSVAEFNRLLKDGPQDDNDVEILQAYNTFRDAKEALADALGMADTGPSAYGCGILDPTEPYFRLLSHHFEWLRRQDLGIEAGGRLPVHPPAHYVAASESSVPNDVKHWTLNEFRRWLEQELGSSSEGESMEREGDVEMANDAMR